MNKILTATTRASWQRSKLRHWSDKKLRQGCREEWWSWDYSSAGLILGLVPTMRLHVFLIRSNMKNSQRASAATLHQLSLEPRVACITCLPASSWHAGKIKKEAQTASMGDLDQHPKILLGEVHFLDNFLTQITKVHT